MEKKIVKRRIKIGWILVLSSILFIMSCDDLPNDSDYYYFNGEFGKIIEGTVRGDGTFTMDVLIYPEVQKVKEYDDFILAYQIPDISDYYKRPFKETFNPELYDSLEWKHHCDSINHRIDRIRKFKECYWIIQKRTKKVYGPLTKKEYDRLCIKLDVKKKVNDGKDIGIYWMGP